MAIHPLLLLFLATMAGAVDIFGSNDSLPLQAAQLLLILPAPDAMLKPFIEPLTTQAGMGSDADTLNNIVIEGTFKSVSTNSAGTVNKGDIALISCDSNNSSFLNQNDLVGLIAPNNPGAIVLYSLVSSHCDIEDTGSFIQYFTLRNVTSDTIRMLVSSPPTANATIRTNTPHPTATPQSTRNQTPAVAMSVLYAVTGIVTVLFLVIITTGAWRAHNNPHRYGPRNAVPGRPRQSRAKGLAKAMLETLPIVKFGDPLPTKGEHRDIEHVELNDTHTTETPEATSGHATITADSEPKTGPQADAAPVSADAEAAAPKHDEPDSTPQTDAETSDEHLGCSICTEDFTKGENVRVLPCNHQYHPACIDPWLLNVSGTCPLCRVDLRPVRSNTSEPTSPTEAAADEIPSGESDPVHHSRIQRILATRHAPVHERMAILRQLASESGQGERHINNPSTAGAGEGSRNRYRLANRMFASRTRRTSAAHAPEQPNTAAEQTNIAEQSSAATPPVAATTASTVSTSPTAPPPAHTHPARGASLPNAESDEAATRP